MRRTRRLAALLLLTALLTACAAANTSRTTTPTSTPTPTQTPASAVLQQADPAQAAVACGSTADQASNYAGFLQDGSIYVRKPRLGGSPGDQLPDGTSPNMPYEVDVEMSLLPHANVQSQFTSYPAVNPSVVEEGSGALAFDVCNGDKTQAHVINGTLVRVDTYTPYHGQLNAWGPGCDVAYARDHTSGYGGLGPVGCGFGFIGQAYLHATFSGTVQTGAVATAVPGTTDPLPEGNFVPLPISLVAGKMVNLSTGITFPEAPATYTVSLGLSVDHLAPVWMPISTPFLLAPVAQKWSGAGCTTAQMHALIPAATTPPTFYICPVS